MRKNVQEALKYAAGAVLAVGALFGFAPDEICPKPTPEPMEITQ